MWIVIASEALLFGGLFMLYAAYRDQHAAEFHAAAARDIAWMGGTNTIILLVSSFAMAVAIHRLRDGANPRLWIYAVLALGTSFLAIKGIEWSIHIRDGIVPGAGPRGESLFYSLYFLMTGLHAAHVIVGLALIAWARTRLDVLPLVGLYWHFVDVVWVFLWPMFYLVK